MTQTHKPYSNLCWISAYDTLNSQYFALKGALFTLHTPPPLTRTTSFVSSL